MPGIGWVFAGFEIFRTLRAEGEGLPVFSLRIKLHVLKHVTKCSYCGRELTLKGRGRPKLYCRPSHRVRASEKRREREQRVPLERAFRVLRQRLESLQGWRVQQNKTPGIDEIRRSFNLPRNKAYQRAVERVREALIPLAAE